MPVGEVKSVKSEKTAAYLQLILTFSLWGSLYVAGKLVLESLPTFTIVFFRYVFAAALIGSLLRIRGTKTKKIAKKDYKYIVIIGFFGYFLSISSQFLGIRFASATLASIINSINPITIMLAAAVFLRERLSPQKLLGIALALVGVYITVGGFDSGTQMTGILFSLGSVALWAVVSVVTRKVTQNYDPLKITFYGMLLALCCNAPLCLYELHTAETIRVSLPVAALLLYMGLFCTGLTYFLWNRCLSRLEAGICSMFYPVQPLVSAVLGVLFLREKVTASLVLGGALIIGGVLAGLAQRKGTVPELPDAGR